MAELNHKVIPQPLKDLLIQFFEAELDEMRESNDQPKPEGRTAFLRGRIAYCKRMLAILRGKMPADLPADMPVHGDPDEKDEPWF